MSKLRQVQAELLHTQCAEVFSMLEQQSNKGLTVQDMQWMPQSLVQLLPLRTCTALCQGRLELVRVFDMPKAGALLELLEFPDFPRTLREMGYNAAKVEFIERLKLHVQSEQAKLISLY